MNKNEEDPSIQLGEFLGNTFENSRERIKQKLNEHLTTPVNIGIVGSRGTGKSTLIRAIIDLFPPDPRAPATGSIHRTRYPAPYLHPESENIVFWDCPGLGGIEPGESTNRFDFTRQNYFKKITKLDNEEENEKIKNRLPNFVIPERVTYDCFLICGDNGLNQDEADLAKIFSEQNINCYFVKTKFDNDLETIEQNYEDPLTDEQVQAEIDKIRQNFVEILANRFGLQNFEDRIFVVSAMVNKKKNKDNRHLYDFPLLQRSIMENMPDEKKNTLIMALLPLAKEDVSTKCNLLRKRINLASVLSGVVGLSPIPGTSFVVDLALITKELLTYAKTLNLSKEMIEQMSVSFGINYDSIEQNVLNNHVFVKTVVEFNEKSILSESFLSLVGSRIAFALITFLGSVLVANSVEEFVKFIPIIGSIVGSITSFTTTQVSLRKILNEFEKTTLELIEYCSENKTI